MSPIARNRQRAISCERIVEAARTGADRVGLELPSKGVLTLERLQSVG